jgi:hypothetical protein
MKLHANAALSLNQRRRMVRRVSRAGWSLTKAARRPKSGSAHARSGSGATWPRGRAGLFDRSSLAERLDVAHRQPAHERADHHRPQRLRPQAPRSIPHRTHEGGVEAIASLRRLRMTVKANEEENADLFWGVRGGGGNFGIVTEFEFRLNPVGPTVLAGQVMWAMEDSPKVVRFYREWIKEVPDELTTIVTHRRVPAVPAMPEELHGRHVVVVGTCYAGAGRGRGEGLEAAAAVRLTSARPVRPDAVRQPPGHARSELPPSLVVLHPLRQGGGRH